MCGEGGWRHETLAFSKPVCKLFRFNGHLRKGSANGGRERSSLFPPLADTLFIFTRQRKQPCVPLHGEKLLRWWSHRHLMILWSCSAEIRKDASCTSQCHPGDTAMHLPFVIDKQLWRDAVPPAERHNCCPAQMGKEKSMPVQQSSFFPWKSQITGHTQSLVPVPKEEKNRIVKHNVHSGTGIECRKNVSHNNST